MKKILIWILVLLVAGAFIPVMESVSQYDVAVTWTVSEKVPTNHVITYDGREFTILAGQEVTQTHKLYGGANLYGFIYGRFHLLIKHAYSMTSGTESALN